MRFSAATTAGRLLPQHRALRARRRLSCIVGIPIFIPDARSA
ncbi:MAG TPA: hypothetical protein PKD01_03020 [Mesorhizobium sp.]|nr:hypothetical protein [Mesorhizobium sp.]